MKIINKAVDSRLSIAAYNRGANYKKLQLDRLSELMLIIPLDKSRMASPVVIFPSNSREFTIYD